MNKHWLLLLLLSLWLPLNPIQAQEDCPANLSPRLVIGEQGRRLADGANNLRDTPALDGSLVGLLDAGETFTVLDGPLCADGYIWWQIQQQDVTGWTAEGDPDSAEYWLEPRGQQVTQTDTNGLTQTYVVAADGTREREECWLPPDDYTRVTVGYADFNTRTLAMLDHANQLYQQRGGILNLRLQISQGSYTGGAVTASFGTHDGGGAVDISVRSPENSAVLWDEIPLMIDSLRVAGFAAWLRTEDQLYAGSVIHIHAIAIGDAELSLAAREQIDGEYGYLRGYNGLPPEYGGPGLDEYGGPVVCRWMTERGFPDLRN